MNIPFQDINKENQPLLKTYQKIFERVVNSSGFVLGDELRKFEQNFAHYLGVKYCVGVNSGTDALIMGLRCLGIGPGVEVITVPNSFFATLEAILHVGARPVFVDVNADTALIDTTQIPKKITTKTRALLPVHLYGQVADMDEVLNIAKKYKLAVLEDACQAHGSTYKGKMAGTFGRAACFSFYPGKNLGALGDGGALVTDDAEIAAMAEKLRNHGGVKKYEHEYLGYNSRLDSLQAAILTEKLKHLDEWNAKRAKLASYYLEKLGHVEDIKSIRVLEENKSNHHLFVVQTPPGEREVLQKKLKQQDIETGIHYPTPLHRLPILQRERFETFPITEALAGTALSLPLYSSMTENQIDTVVEALKNAL